MTDVAFLIPADPDNPGVRELAQPDGSLVLIASADEAMTIRIGAPSSALLLTDATPLELAGGGDLALTLQPQS